MVGLELFLIRALPFFFLSLQENYGIIKCEGQINGKSVKVSSYSNKYDSE